MSTSHSKSEHKQNDPVSFTELMDAERILINPLNQSISKQQYSFPKADRWQRVKTTIQNYQFYDIPNTKSRIATSIGKSHRESQNKKRGKDGPGPDRYQYRVQGEFGSSERMSSRKGFGFGIGRDENKMGNFLGKKSDAPPPGSYETAKNKGSQDVSFPRDKRLKTEVSRNSLGPGAYQVTGSLIEDKQLLSNHHRFASPKMMNTSMDNRRKKQTEPVPPPLYNPKLTSKGEQLGMGKHRGFRIGTSKRINPVATVNFPGPGRYKIFSQFISKGKS